MENSLKYMCFNRIFHSFISSRVFIFLPSSSFSQSPLVNTELFDNAFVSFQVSQFLRKYLWPPDNDYAAITWSFKKCITWKMNNVDNKLKLLIIVADLNKFKIAVVNFIGSYGNVFSVIYDFDEHCLKVVGLNINEIIVLCIGLNESFLNMLMTPKDISLLCFYKRNYFIDKTINILHAVITHLMVRIFFIFYIVILYVMKYNYAHIFIHLNYKPSICDCNYNFAFEFVSTL